jgi:predicted MFS family arabinose efflux permease
VADIAGPGRYNVAHGAVATARGIGASLSASLARIIVVKAGYSAAFLVLAAVAAEGLLLFWSMMPETRNGDFGGTAAEGTVIGTNPSDEIE